MGVEPGTSPSTFSRRAFLAACAPVVASCARREAVPRGPQPVSIPVERIPVGVRVNVTVDGRPVELLRTGSGVTARSLLCTHQGCEIAWSDEANAYLCPCHEGRFDAGGRPLEGPPPSPLRTLPARVEGAYLLVGPA